jgi:hypothetical protein
VSVMVVYKSSSEHARDVDEYLHDFEKRTARTLETIDPDSRRGADLCRLYDVVEYPTIIAVSKDGQLLHMWRGIPLPLIDEVSYYVD